MDCAACAVQLPALFVILTVPNIVRRFRAFQCSSKRIWTTYWASENIRRDLSIGHLFCIEGPVDARIGKQRKPGRRTRQYKSEWKHGATERFDANIISEGITISMSHWIIGRVATVVAQSAVKLDASTTHHRHVICTSSSWTLAAGSWEHTFAQ